MNWSQVELDDVEAFLREAGDEGLTWEAKGGATPRPESILKAVCGFANSQGGYLILGAERIPDGQGWTSNGVEFKVEEPGTWISSLVLTGLRPRPAIDVKVWERSGRKRLAVVAIDPVPTPPCMTAQGRIYERASGQTVPVIDPTVLAQLYARGDTAKQRAEAEADRALARLAEVQPLIEGGQFTVVLALAPTGGPEDRARRLFSENFAQGVFQDTIGGALGAGHLVVRPWQAKVEQDGLTATIVGHEVAWTVRASWDGSVAFSLATDRSAALAPSEPLLSCCRRKAPFGFIDTAGLIAWSGAHRARR